MELSAVITIVVLVAAYFWLKHKDRTDAALNSYARALSHAGINREYHDDDPTEGLRLQRIAQSLDRAGSMKRRDWAGKADLMRETWSDVCEARGDPILAAAGLHVGHPGYEESKNVAASLLPRLERSRGISGWVP